MNIEALKIETFKATKGACWDDIVKVINYLFTKGHLNLWRDIDTAPRDGTRILSSTDHGAVYIVWFSLKFQRFVGGFHGIGDDTILTKWMPVPGVVKGEMK